MDVSGIGSSKKYQENKKKNKYKKQVQILKTCVNISLYAADAVKEKDR